MILIIQVIRQDFRIIMINMLKKINEDGEFQLRIGIYKKKSLGIYKIITLELKNTVSETKTSLDWLNSRR